MVKGEEAREGKAENRPGSWRSAGWDSAGRKEGIRSGMYILYVVHFLMSSPRNHQAHVLKATHIEHKKSH